MVDLARWLGAQLDADERIARAAIEDEFLTCGRWLARGPYGDGDQHGNIQSELNEQIIEDDLPWSFTEHAAEHDPVRVLREIDAKRKLLADHPIVPRDIEPTVIDGEEIGGPYYPFGCANCHAEPGSPEVNGLGYCFTWKTIASVYEHRPGYAEAVASVD